MHLGLWAAIPAIWLAACGGGGGGSPNHAPVVDSPNGDQLRIIGFPFDYDVTKGGQAFHDPDGDTLMYTVSEVLPAQPEGLIIIISLLRELQSLSIHASVRRHHAHARARDLSRR